MKMVMRICRDKRMLMTVMVQPLTNTPIEPASGMAIPEKRKNFDFGGLVVRAIGIYNQSALNSFYSF